MCVFLQLINGISQKAAAFTQSFGIGLVLTFKLCLFIGFISGRPTFDMFPDLVPYSSLTENNLSPLLKIYSYNDLVKRMKVGFIKTNLISLIMIIFNV